MNIDKFAINRQNFARVRLQLKFAFIIWPEEQLRLKILKKLRTSSLNSEFTGSFKKKL